MTRRWRRTLGEDGDKARTLAIEAAEAVVVAAHALELGSTRGCRPQPTSLTATQQLRRDGACSTPADILLHLALNRRSGQVVRQLCIHDLTYLISRASAWSSSEGVDPHRSWN